MSKYTMYYKSKRDMYRDMAKHWVNWSKTTELSETERIGISKFFLSIGKRFGLITEFRNIGVIQ